MPNTQEWLDQEYPLDQRNKITKLDIDFKNLTGELKLVGFSNLTKLYCSHNQLTNLNLTPCPGLTKLSCSFNQLTKLDLTGCSGLTTLNCDSNKLTKLDLTGCSGLTTLNCYKNQLTNLNLTPCSGLTELNCNSNKLTKLDLTPCSGLTELYCYYNQLTKLDLTHSYKLKNLLANNNKLVDIIFPTDGEKLLLERVDISGNKQLDYAKIESRFLKSLPILVASEVEEITREKFQAIITQKLTIFSENIHYFSTWWNPNCALIISNKLFELVIYEPAEAKKVEVFKVIKLTGNWEKLNEEQVKNKVDQLKEQLNSDHPILALYSPNSGFSPNEVMEITAIEDKEELKKVNQAPDNYLKPTDLVWRTMNIPGAYHVAVYLGNKRVTHIGSSKFMKDNKLTNNKKLMGARVDHWDDFFHDTDKIFRYHLIIPFQRPSKIQENITKAVLAEYGVKEYNFLGNNCEHFATLVVCGIPFSTQADKISMLTHKLHWDLAKEIAKNDQEFALMSNSVSFERRLAENQEHLTTQIASLTAQAELTTKEAEKLTSLVDELQNLTELPIPALNWEYIIKDKANIPGNIEKIISLKSKDNKNQFLVINKVLLYAVRLLEYDPQTQELTELKRYAKNKVGYQTLESALAKVNRLLANEQSETSSLQTISK